MQNSILRNVASTQGRVPETFICLFVSESNSGWDLYKDSNGKLHSISKTSPSGDSLFGTRDHIIRLMSSGHFNGQIATDAGLEEFSGACTPLPIDYMENKATYARLRNLSSTWRFRVLSKPREYVMPTLGEEVDPETMPSSWLQNFMKKNK